MLPLLALALAQPLPAGDRLLTEFATNDATATVFRREGNGFRLRPPVRPGAPNRVGLWTTQATYALSGDFALEADFDAAQLGPADGGKPAAESNVELAADGRGWRGYYGISVSSDPAAGRCFRVVRVHPNRDGTHYDVRTFPRKADRGRVAVRRAGSEVAFVASDAPGEPLRELVRYPDDPLIARNPRLSAYQGDANAPLPVDVLVSNFLITGRIVRGPAAGEVRPPAAPPTAWAASVDFARSRALLADFAGNDDAGAIRSAGNDLRLKPPVRGHATGANTYWFRDARVGLSGDFELSFAYALAELGPPGPQGRGFASFGVMLDTGHPLGSISLDRAFSRERGHHYFSTRHTPVGKDGLWDTQHVGCREPAPNGRMTVRRVGAEVALLAQDGDGLEWEVARVPFATKPVKIVRLVAYQGDTPETPIDVTLSDFRLRSAALTDAGTGLAFTPEAVRAVAESGGAAVAAAEPPPRSRKWALLLAVVAVAALGGLVAWRASGRKRDVPSTTMTQRKTV